MTSTLTALMAAGSVSVLAAVVAGLFARKGTNISGAGAVTEAALALIQPQNERIEELQASVREMIHSVSAMQLEIASLKRHIDVLSSQLREAGLDPLPPTHGETE